ncbi:MAG: type II toxin-antitoxin system VapB family antitoxin [Candidatus Acididesulfobacter diazotrophicus]|jgi:Arc/MetJ family transcription regulator|uniref:Type II toxin-antitoxin system VapB family antitoxin n=1 Tax=Candidatus Acididesulfobacter diazotrophicus TaxID=2597226 RepID=A0A519BLM1_9DELT|nr:MAG: type II toxin-antitoxin system VapB family antitoxin [Candidatus Acididesulfobacter diazotrophicus]
MRTNIVLDDKLVEEAIKLTNIKTKKELINLSLKELVENRSRMKLQDLYGKIKFSEDYDYKKMRSGD